MRRVARIPGRPGEWEICGHCRGEGQSSAYLGAYTAEEFREAFDDEDAERYFRGDYDRPCEHCGGSGKVWSDTGGHDAELAEHGEHGCPCEECEAERARDDYNERRTMWYESGCPDGGFL